MRTSGSAVKILSIASFALFLTLLVPVTAAGSNGKTVSFTVSLASPRNHLLHVESDLSGFEGDTILLSIPAWMPGYYQVMNYAGNISGFAASGKKGSQLDVGMKDADTWYVVTKGTSELKVSYDVKADRKFVANSFADSSHAYIVTAATFMYPEGKTSLPVSVRVNFPEGWSVATGLQADTKSGGVYTAPDFDILYDCPILGGKLEELPSFSVYGVNHRFIAWMPGTFDSEAFTSELSKAVKAGIDIIGDIPYDEYTFIGIGPGAGGIEHLNNTTVSFSSRGLDTREGTVRMLKFLAHEYFHHYNVKRIRPYELGPFDYSSENRTNLLWFSEGLTVYYEYLMLSRAGIITTDELLASLSANINAYENDPGRQFQSLSQASYNTWSDGPFGGGKGDRDVSISYYDKGPVVGMIIDFAIRNATGNKKSVDDVMRYLYNHYYRELGRGFTDAELQSACEAAAGVSLKDEFEYICTTREIDYSKYLSYAGLQLSVRTDTAGKKTFALERREAPGKLQTALLKGWSGEEAGR